MGSEILWVSLTAIASWVMVVITWFLIRSQIKLSKEDLKVRLQTNYEEKFDSPSMIAERKRLAEQLLSNASHEDIQEPVMNFFESVGILLRREYLDEEMVWTGFSFHAIRWWSACKDYILQERRLQNNDDTIFREFEELVDELYEFEAEERYLTRAQLEPSKQDLQRFLEAEKNL